MPRAYASHSFRFSRSRASLSTNTNYHISRTLSCPTRNSVSALELKIRTTLKWPWLSRNSSKEGSRVIRRNIIYTALHIMCTVDALPIGFSKFEMSQCRGCQRMIVSRLATGVDIWGSCGILERYVRKNSQQPACASSGVQTSRLRSGVRTCSASL